MNGSLLDIKAPRRQYGRKLLDLYILHLSILYIADPDLELCLHDKSGHGLGCDWWQSVIHGLAKVPS